MKLLSVYWIINSKISLKSYTIKKASTLTTFRSLWYQITSYIKNNYKHEVTVFRHWTKGSINLWPLRKRNPFWWATIILALHLEVISRAHYMEGVTNRTEHGSVTEVRRQNSTDTKLAWTHEMRSKKREEFH